MSNHLNILNIEYKHQSWDDFENDFNELASSHPNKNIIVDLSHCNQLTKDNLKQLKTVIKSHYKNKKSMVLVINQLSPEKIPSKISFAPTILEATDIIEMEEIERDLGF